MYQVKDIVHERGRFWVLRERRNRRVVYLVLEIGATCSTVCSTYDIGEEGRERAIADCSSRADGTHWFYRRRAA